MLSVSGYKTKKDLKAAVNTPLMVIETSMFGLEYRTGTKVVVVGPSPYNRKWYAEVWTDSNGIITRVK